MEFSSISFSLTDKLWGADLHMKYAVGTMTESTEACLDSVTDRWEEPVCACRQVKGLRGFSRFDGQV